MVAEVDYCFIPASTFTVKLKVEYYTKFLLLNDSKFVELNVTGSPF
jgi:hypothetical protein